MSYNRETFRMIERVKACGISDDDAWTLRRIGMTLHRWGELECGSDAGAVERDEETGKTYWITNDNNGRTHRWPTPDRETGALKRLATLAAKYPALEIYVQGDCRGAPLYILRPGDVPAGERAESYYSRGVAVHA